MPENVESSQFTSLQPEINYEDLRNRIIARLREMRKGWQERRSANYNNLIEIDPERKLWLNGYNLSDQLRLQIVDDQNMPGARYCTPAYCIHDDSIVFDAEGEPVQWISTNVQDLRQRNYISQFPSGAYTFIDIQSATKEQLLMMQEKLTMYSEPWDYFNVETPTEEAKSIAPEFQATQA